MRTEALHIYTYEELSDEAKAKARDWYRKNDDNEYSEFVIDDAKEVAALMGWEIDKIYWSGFSYQGDGACFEGIMRYNKGGAQKLVKAYTNDAELNRIAKAWQSLQRRNFYALEASVKHRGHYYHEMCTVFDCEDTRSNYGWMQKPEAEDDIKEIARDFMRWIYKRLEAEYEYSVSDEVVAENIIANGYEFTEDGEIH
jgi:hypothetical protein